jgi:hypothetical protein
LSEPKIPATIKDKDPEVTMMTRMGTDQKGVPSSRPALDRLTPSAYKIFGRDQEAGAWKKELNRVPGPAYQEWLKRV